MERHQMTLEQVQEIEAEEGFWERLKLSREYWLERLTDVIAAIYNNAVDPARVDQAFWIDKFFEVCGIAKKADSGEREGKKVSV